MHPDTLAHDEKTLLYSRSTRADSLGAFISHSWSSPGLPKYLSLLFDNLAIHALIAAILGGGLVYSYQHWVDLPLNIVVSTEMLPFFQVPKYSSPWEYLAGQASAAAALLLLPSRLHPTYFLDCLCIHQTDLERKLAGIRNLGGFVAMSSSFIIMWDDQYTAP